MGMCLQASGSCEYIPCFRFGAALKYLAGMKSYWILVLGLGMWAAASEIVFSYMPAFQEAQFPVRAPHCFSYSTIPCQALTSCCHITWLSCLKHILSSKECACRSSCVNRSIQQVLAQHRHSGTGTYSFMIRLHCCEAP